LEDTQKFQDVYLPAVDGHNCQLADTQQQGRILGHGVQLFAGPKALEALAKVVLLIGRGVQGIQVAARLEEAAALQRGGKVVQAANKVATGAKAGQAAVQEGKANKPLSIQGPENLYANHPPENLTKLKGDQGWKDKKGNIWKKDRKHNDHWDVTDPKTGKKIKEVDFDGNQIWPDGPKNKNKRK
jgi:hypothetical protein